MSPLVLAAALAKIAVLNLTATGVEPTLTDNLSEVLINEVSALGRYQVIGKSDISAMLGFEAQKQLLSCEQDACVAEIGGALGVEKVVVGNVGKLDDVYLLNLKLIDMTSAQVQARASEEVEGKSKELIAAIHRAVDKLFSKIPGPAPAPADASAQPPADVPKTPENEAKPALPAAATQPPPPAEPASYRWAAWGATGIGAVAVIASVVFALNMHKDEARYASAVSAADISGAKQDAQSAAGRANLSLGVAVVAGVAGGAGLVFLP
jgi:TolB-like protein